MEVTRTSNQPAPLNSVWLLGHQHYQRLYLKFWVLASGVYALLLLLHVYAARAGLVSDERSDFQRILIAVLPAGVLRGHAQWLDPPLVSRVHYRKPDGICSVNDTYGHATGDEALRLFAQACLGCLRAVDVLARWGGEEFVLLMPETPLNAGVLVVKRMRNHLMRPEVWQSPAPVTVAFFAGIAAHAPPESMEVTVCRADVALYQAKSQGRNCTVQA